MDATQIFIAVLAIFIGLWVLALAFNLLVWVFIGALILFAWAGEHNFLGFAAYLACWVFMFPVMAIVCGVIGFMNRDDPWQVG